jgi:hypothetical protein
LPSPILKRSSCVRRSSGFHFALLFVLITSVLYSII